ncbi:hypothetical protein D3C80_1037020 [compost metagenome]
MFFIHVFALEDGAGTKKADTGDNALHHPAQGFLAGTGHLRHQHEQSCPQRYQHMGADAGGLALALALIAQHRAQQRRHHQAHGNPRELFGIGDVGEFGGQGQPDFMPPGVHGQGLCAGGLNNGPQRCLQVLR